MNKQLKGFMEFVREQGVIGLAVGLAIGTQAGKAVEAIVIGFINPIVKFVLSFILSNPDSLEQQQFTIGSGKHMVAFEWGLVFTALITLLAVAAVIYYVIHGLKLDRADKKKE